MFREVKNSFHTHTYLCKHAEGSAIDYAKESYKKGSTAIGISDHMPFPDRRWQDTRMAMEDLKNYDDQIEEARKALPNMIILKGLECEYFKEYHSFYQEEFIEKQKCDYLIGAAHYYPYKGEWRNSFYDINTPEEMVNFSKYFILTMESKIFDFMAHPDNFARAYHKWDENTIACSKDMLEAAEELKMPVEINGNGFRKKEIKMLNGEKRAPYPIEPFWELASNYKIKVIINSDAHKIEDAVSNLNDALKIANKYNIELIPPFEEYIKTKNKKPLS